MADAASAFGIAEPIRTAIPVATAIDARAGCP